MKKIISSLFILSLAIPFGLKAQDAIPPKWRASLLVGQYTAKIGAPSFSPTRIGLQGNVSYQYNKSTKHQLRQSLHLGGFNHRYLQRAVQLYTEFQYEYHFGKGLFINPLAIGGGYVASFSDMTTLKWENNQYVEVKTPMRNNFMMSLGPNIGYESPVKIANRPLIFSLGYRLQVQGIVIQSTVPVVAYSSLQLSAGLPF